VRPVLILAAVELEARALARDLELLALRDHGFPLFGRGEVRLACVGLGAAMLGQRWRAAVGDLRSPLVISAGLCGALDPRLRTADLVLPSAVSGPAGERVVVSVPHHRAAVAIAPSAAVGLLATTREVLATSEDKAALRERTGAVACDMESSVIAAATAAAGLPGIVARAVSDGADQGVPRELTRLVTPAGKLRLGRALALAAQPAIVPRALELRRASRGALRALSAFLAALLG
jgi:adenosylhomocysteine nucleosidase